MIEVEHLSGGDSQERFEKIIIYPITLLSLFNFKSDVTIRKTGRFQPIFKIDKLNMRYKSYCKIKYVSICYRRQ